MKAMLVQGLAGLGAGIIEFASLADDDRSRPDDEDGFDVCALGHFGKTCIWVSLHNAARHAKL